MGRIRACLHVPSPSKFTIVPMEMDRLTDRMGTEPILPIKQSVSIDTMINIDGDGDGDGHGDGTCKQALNEWFDATRASITEKQ